MLLRWQVAISTGFFIIAKTTATVIGTACDTDEGRIFGSENVVYLPIAQRDSPILAVTARSAGNPAAALRALRDAVRRADPDAAVEIAGTGPTVLTIGAVALRAAGVLALSIRGSPGWRPFP